jgi:hypothetical protein
MTKHVDPLRLAELDARIHTMGIHLKSAAGTTPEAKRHAAEFQAAIAGLLVERECLLGPSDSLSEPPAEPTEKHAAPRVAARRVIAQEEAERFPAARPAPHNYTPDLLTAPDLAGLANFKPMSISDNDTRRPVQQPDESDAQLLVRIEHGKVLQAKDMEPVLSRPIVLQSTPSEPSSPARSVVEEARNLMAHGIDPVLVRPGTKKPPRSYDQDTVRTEADFETLIAHPSGIITKQDLGARLGSGDSVDCDCDWPEPMAVLPIMIGMGLLPATASFGKPDKPTSHYLFASTNAPNRKFSLPDFDDPRIPGTGEHDRCILELRSNVNKSKRLTVMPPSGDRAWRYELPMAKVDGDLLNTVLSVAALASLTVRCYPPIGQRNEFRMAFAGVLVDVCGERFTPDQIDDLVFQVGRIARSQQPGKTPLAQAAIDRKAAGDHVYGLRKLIELLGLPVAMIDWVGLKWFGMVRYTRPRDLNDTRPVIEWNESRYDRITLEAQRILLNNKVDVFQSKARMVHAFRHDQEHTELETDGSIKFKRPAGALVQSPVSPETLRWHLQQSISFETWNARARRMVPCAAPAVLVNAYMGNPHIWKLRVFNGIIEAPCLRADGSILQTEGYDPQSGLIADFNGVKFPPIPENPTYLDAQKALHILIDLLREFPFVDGASRSGALSGILTPFQRRAMRDCPFHGDDANSVGTGKSTLGHVTATIATGREATTISLPSSEEEFKKVLLSTLRENPLVVMIDNVKEGLPITGSAICTILTQPQWKERILGESTELEVSTQCLIVGNGNNLIFGSDMASRAIRCRMNRNEDRPDQHQFERDLLAYTKEHRAEFVVASLTILRGYIAWVNAGRQVMEYRSTWNTGQMEVTTVRAPQYTPSRFHDWDRMIREPLLWLGVADPFDTAADVFTDDPGKMDLAALIDGLISVGTGNDQDGKRMTAGELAAAAASQSGEALRIALGDHHGSVSIAKYLRRYIDTPCNGWMIKREEVDHQQRYWVECRRTLV